MIKIRIGPKNFHVSLVKGLTDNDGSKKLNGHIEYDRGLIKIEKEHPEQTQEITFWHEVIHAILTQYSIDLGDGQGERVCDAIANGMVEFCQDNPFILDFNRGFWGMLESDRGG